MDNREISLHLQQIADLMEIIGESRHRSQAYRRAANAVRYYPEPVAELVSASRLQEIPGVGKTLADVIGELVQSGRSPLLDELQEQVPISLLEFLKVPGLGPRTIHVIYKELGIADLEALEQAAADGRLRSLPGFGPKKEQTLLAEIRALMQRSQRTPYSLAEPIARALVLKLARVPGVSRAALAGSLRRGCDTVRDIDLVACSERPETVIDAFCDFPEVDEILIKGNDMASVRLRQGITCDLVAVKPPAFHAAFQYYTGSAAHNVRLRRIAEAEGMKLTERGLFAASGELVTTLDEHQLYRHLGLDYIHPELREDRGEIEAALAGRLPVLIKLRDLRGNLHTHSDWSDGRQTLEALQQTAAAYGYEYVAVTDHSQSLAVANGLSPERLAQQVEAIEGLRERLPKPWLFTGMEVDILKDGELDLDNDWLARLDIVVASVHSHFRLDEQAMTQRLLRAIEHPSVDMIGHPSGRRLGIRDPYAVDMEQVIEAAAATGTVLEINANPERMDLADVWVRRAVDAGVWLAINTDAHDAEGFSHMRFGIQMARRGWATCANVINAWPLETLQAFLRLPKAQRRTFKVDG